MSVAPHASQPLRTVARFVVWGILVGALVGGLVGLVLGLIAYPPTAWAAVIEVGLPAALLGAVAGLIVGVVVILVRARGSGRRDSDAALNMHDSRFNGMGNSR